MPVAGEQLRRARERAGLTQQQVADAVGATRQTVSGWERRASMDDTRHLGKLFEVLKLDENGRPKDSVDLMDIDVRAMTVPDLIALQGRLTAEFARRLARIPDSPRTADPLVDFPGGVVFGHDGPPDVVLGVEDRHQRRES